MTSTTMIEDSIITTDKIENIELNKLHADSEFNSRGEIKPLDIVELTNSVKEHGLLQPISVYPYNEEEREKYHKDYKIILGYCRYTACIILNFKTIPCVVKPWMTETKARILNLAENIKRKDLNILQEAKSIEKLKFAGYTMNMVSKELGVSMAWVQNRFCVLSFPEDIQKECAIGTVNQIHIKDLYSLPLEKQYEEVRRINDQRLRGEKHIKVKKPIAANSKKGRTPASMNKMLDFLMDELGPSFGTRTLAWASGNISTLDLFTDVKAQLVIKGKPFIFPTDDF